MKRKEETYITDAGIVKKADVPGLVVTALCFGMIALLIALGVLAVLNS